MTLANSVSKETSPKRRPVRVWVDGCFDMMHHGHANALRQAKAMGDVLVVGVHNDAAILQHKGPPLMKEEERYLVVEACKWVDEVVRDAPYYTTVDMLDKYHCDFCVHGDDITTMADGRDCYEEVKKAGRYKECRRTSGVSTTEMVGRMLLMTRNHQIKGADSVEKMLKERSIHSFSRDSSTHSPYTGVSGLLPTSKRILQFSSGREPRSSDKVIYADGAFDLFHPGHIQFLAKAKAMGDYLLVGVHDDISVNAVRGENFPIMNVYERVLTVLACKYVDEVIIGAPYSVTKEVLDSVYKVNLVVHGKTPVECDADGSDPYSLPKERGIYREIETDFQWFTVDTILQRIIDQRALYEERNRKKEAKELLLQKK